MSQATSKTLSKIERLLLLRVQADELEALEPLMAAAGNKSAEQRFASLRIIVRTVHSVIESTLALMASEIIRVAEAGKTNLSEKEKALITDKTPTRFVKRARAVVRNFAELHGGLIGEARTVIQLPDQIANWTPLRHRITHPKRLQDFTLKPGDIDACWVVLRWYMKLSQWVIEIERKDSKDSSELRQQLIEELMAQSSGNGVSDEIIEEIKRKLLNTME